MSRNILKLSTQRMIILPIDMGIRGYYNSAVDRGTPVGSSRVLLVKLWIVHKYNLVPWEKSHLNPGAREPGIHTIHV
jgi:hypothetical protein